MTKKLFEVLDLIDRTSKFSESLSVDEEQQSKLKLTISKSNNKYLLELELQKQNLRSISSFFFSFIFTETFHRSQAKEQSAFFLVRLDYFQLRTLRFYIDFVSPINLDKKSLEDFRDVSTVFFAEIVTENLWNSEKRLK